MARVKAPRRGRIIWVIVILLVVITAAAASGVTPRGKDVLLAIQHFMLFYSGVLALIALTAAVGAGVVATDRIVMAPASRVVAQAVHRAISFGALAFLVTHIVLEIVAHRSHVIDSVVPFLAQGRRFYIGLGTVASDLVVLLVVTGIARGRFASRRPWTWRAIHATAYLAWPLSIVHGLLAGRHAKPYVDWSYGACVAAVALALLIRFVATIRSRREKAAHPLPDYISSAAQAPASAMMQHEMNGWWSALPRAGDQRDAVPEAHQLRRAVPEARDLRGAVPEARDLRGAVPEARDLRGAVPQARRMPRALPPGAGGPAAIPQPQPPYIATRRLATPRPDLPIPQPHQQEMRPMQQREWQEQQQEAMPWQQREWQEQEQQQMTAWQQHQAAQAEELSDEYPAYPAYPTYPGYPGADVS